MRLAFGGIAILLSALTLAGCGSYTPQAAGVPTPTPGATPAASEAIFVGSLPPAATLGPSLPTLAGSFFGKDWALVARREYVGDVPASGTTGAVRATDFLSVAVVCTGPGVLYVFLDSGRVLPDEPATLPAADTAQLSVDCPTTGTPYSASFTGAGVDIADLVMVVEANPDVRYRVIVATQPNAAAH